MVLYYSLETGELYPKSDHKVVKFILYEVIKIKNICNVRQLYREISVENFMLIEIKVSFRGFK